MDSLFIFCVGVKNQAAFLQRAAALCVLDSFNFDMACIRSVQAAPSGLCLGHFKQSSPACLIKGQAEQPDLPERDFPCVQKSLHGQAEARPPCSAGYYGRPFEARNKTKGGAFAADKDYFSFRVGDQQVGLLDTVKRKCLGAYSWPVCLSSRTQRQPQLCERLGA